jgi:small multidrug resistance pump
MQKWLVLSLAILSEVMATTALKASDGFTRLVPSVIVMLGYGTSFYLLSIALKAIPVGVAYALWSGIGIALITLIGWKYYGQKLDGAGLLGLALILTGIFILNFFSKSSLH